EGKYNSGKYSSNLFLEGNINSNLTPDYRSLRGRGFLETNNAVMTDFPALQAIGQQLQIKELQQALPLGSSKNWFDMKDGYVEVPPFDIQAGKLSLTVAGRHGIDQQLDYQIQTAVPLKQVQQFTQQIQLPKGIQALQELVSSGQSDWVADLEIGIKGLVNQPKTNIRIKGTHSAKEDKSPTDSPSKSENIINSTIERGVDSLREKLSQGITTELDTLLKQNLPVNRDSLQKSVDQIKKQLEELNPFKKKKKSN
ncbi:MAG: AsmA-like C-terminal region-containing protein, partial [Saprospiraceae bacterium]|nr:AsmA-like C-terminal region-containing protein [Saprospiraceae bacterium]